MLRTINFIGRLNIFQAKLHHLMFLYFKIQMKTNSRKELIAYLVRNFPDSKVHGVKESKFLIIKLLMFPEYLFEMSCVWVYLRDH